jgi:arsenate reductase-like glutaredoxin family protein
LERSCWQGTANSRPLQEAIALMLTQPSMIKRPVLDHGGAEVKG